MHLLTFKTKNDCQQFTERFKVAQHMNNGGGTAFSGIVVPKEFRKIITLYLIPFEVDDEQVNRICEKELKIGAPLKITYGHHRNYPNLINVFLHL